MQKIFRVFFQSALICPILTHFEIFFFQSALTWSQIKRTFKFFFKVRNFLKCVVTYVAFKVVLIMMLVETGFGRVL